MGDRKGEETQEGVYLEGSISKVLIVKEKRKRTARCRCLYPRST
jgi:hypothetical protein